MPAIETLFAELAELTPAERRERLVRLDLGDEERRRLEALLAAHDGAGPFLETPAAELLSEPLPEERYLGPYKLVRALGRGGMGTVWLAERVDGDFRRRVAVKILHPHLGRSGLAERFRRERRILAGLDHPGIARLLDSGATSDGRPYFVLEAVTGALIDRHCEEEALSLRARIELLLKVAAALEHAHRHLVVHRDLKPSNILVSEDGEPKLLDFGIAKLLTPDPEDECGETTLDRAQPLTPQYASPEQLRGERVTTATDVYSLGLVLFRVLAGRLPYEAGAASPAELEQRIAAGLPRASSLAPAERARELAGDLDTILAKATHPEPERRYPSVAELAEDLSRSLDGRPIRAREEDALYRLGKFLRRHRAPVAAALLALTAIVGLSLAAVLEAAKAKRERDRSEQVTRVLTNLFEAADPFGEGGRDLTVRQILDRDAERVVTELASQPQVQAQLMDTLGCLYRQLAEYERGQALLDGALSIRRREFGSNSLEVAETLDHLGSLYHGWGRYAQSETTLREALDIKHRRLGAEHPAMAETLNKLGEVAYRKGDQKEAEALLQQALAIRRRESPAGSAELAETLNDLGNVLYSLGDPAAAEPMMRETIAMRRRWLGDQHPLTADSVSALAILIATGGDPKGSVPLFREVLEIQRRALGPEHPRVAGAMGNLGGALAMCGQYAEAEPLLQQAVEVRRKALGERHSLTAQSLFLLADLYRRQGQLAEAEPRFREYVDILRNSISPRAWELGNGLSVLGAVVCARGKRAAAEPLLREGLAILQGALPADNPRVTRASKELDTCLAGPALYSAAVPQPARRPR